MTVSVNGSASLGSAQRRAGRVVRREGAWAAQATHLAIVEVLARRFRNQGLWNKVLQRHDVTGRAARARGRSVATWAPLPGGSPVPFTRRCLSTSASMHVQGNVGTKLVIRLVRSKARSKQQSFAEVSRFFALLAASQLMDGIVNHEHKRKRCEAPATSTRDKTTRSAFQTTISESLPAELRAFP